VPARFPLRPSRHGHFIKTRTKFRHAGKIDASGAGSWVNPASEQVISMDTDFGSIGVSVLWTGSAVVLIDDAAFLQDLEPLHVKALPL
jgi:hypothetical protein